MRAILFQASGTNFQPSSINYPFAEAFDPGQLATFGNELGSASTRGSATIRAPAAMPDESEISGLCHEVSSVLERMKAAGANQFIFWIRRSNNDQCNEEISRMELQQIAALNCHLFFSARKLEDEPLPG